MLYTHEDLSSNPQSTNTKPDEAPHKPASPAPASVTDPSTGIRGVTEQRPDVLWSLHTQACVPTDIHVPHPPTCTQKAMILLPKLNETFKKNDKDMLFSLLKFFYN